MKRFILALAFGTALLSTKTYGNPVNYYHYEDLSFSLKYRDIIGKEFSLSGDFFVFAQARLDGERVVDGPLSNHSMTACDGPGQGGRGLQYFGRLPKGTRVHIARVVELNSKTPVYWAEVLNPPDEKYRNLKILISLDYRLRNYSSAKYPSGARKLNEAFFEELLVKR